MAVIASTVRAMRRALVAVPLLAVLAGCGGGGHGDAAAKTSQVDSATVNSALRHAAHGAHVLQHLHRSGGIEGILGEYEIARGDFQAAESLLSPAPTGVPDATARESVAELRTVSSGLTAAIDCFQGQVATLGYGGSCDAVGRRLASSAGAAGRAMAKLMPYASISSATVGNLAS